MSTSITAQVRPSDAVRGNEKLIRELATRYRTSNPRLFGSTATQTDTPTSDLDILVDTTAETTMFDLGGLQEALRHHLSVPVDIRTPGDLPAFCRDQIVKAARPI